MLWVHYRGNQWSFILLCSALSCAVASNTSHHERRTDGCFVLLSESSDKKKFKTGVFLHDLINNNWVSYCRFFTQFLRPAQYSNCGSCCSSFVWNKIHIVFIEKPSDRFLSFETQLNIALWQAIRNSVKESFWSFLGPGDFALSVRFFAHATTPTTCLRHDLRLSQRFKPCFKMLQHFFLSYTTNVDEL